MICIYRPHDTREDIRMEMPSTFEALKRGLEIAHERNCMVTYDVFNDGLGKWQTIGYFHPDYTFTDSFNDRYRWTGDRVDYWEKTDLEPFDPFKRNN